MLVDAAGNLQGSDLYRARVRNHAKLAYPSVARWLEGGVAPAQVHMAVEEGGDAIEGEGLHRRGAPGSAAGTAGRARLEHGRFGLKPPI